ncbi:Ribonuclease h domain [Thalictrum thalictroides]|uniref:Ribonuclease h domain n=1 Tax=Thalictrum thalictroides TaxID=46969 RepID=A0A7J6VJH4_THATH|nr:Ribonuclease h domain [Thalictrum thalictroides]
MGIYKWPSSIVREAETLLRNFLWSGNPSRKKGITVAWEKVCKPYSEGGLNIRRLGEINKAMLMKQAWNFISGKGYFADYLRHKYLDKNGEIVKYYKHSTIWPGIRWALQEIKDKVRWIVGDGKSVDLWRDNWLGESIQHRLHLTTELKNCTSKVSSIVHGQEWKIPPQLQRILEEAQLQVDNRHTPNVAESDMAVWIPYPHGKFSTKSAFEMIRKKHTQVGWSKALWNGYLHPRQAAMAWKINVNAIETMDNVMKRGIPLASRCCLYAMKKMKQRGKLIKDIWNSAVIATIVAIWKLRNKITHEEKDLNAKFCEKFIENQVKVTARLSKATGYNNLEKLKITREWQIILKPPPAPIIQQCSWKLPEQHMMKINVDGASRGNPGKAGWGAIFRNSRNEVCLTVCKGMGIASNFMSELQGIVESIEMRLARGWDNLVVESDSKAVVQALQKNEVPWQFSTSWRKIMQRVKETLLDTDITAKRGAGLLDTIMTSWEGRPPWLDRVESPYEVYFRFSNM